MVRARTDALVTCEMLDSVIDALLAQREVRRERLKQDGVQGRFRRTFIFALLSKTSFAEYYDGALHLR
jgi:hypothetical protein